MQIISVLLTLSLLLTILCIIPLILGFIIYLFINIRLKYLSKEFHTPMFLHNQIEIVNEYNIKNNIAIFSIPLFNILIIFIELFNIFFLKKKYIESKNKFYNDYIEYIFKNSNSSYEYHVITEIINFLSYNYDDLYYTVIVNSLSALFQIESKYHLLIEDGVYYGYSKDEAKIIKNEFNRSVANFIDLCLELKAVNNINPNIKFEFDKYNDFIEKILSDINNEKAIFIGDKQLG